MIKALAVGGGDTNILLSVGSSAGHDFIHIGRHRVEMLGGTLSAVKADRVDRYLSWS